MNDPHVGNLPADSPTVLLQTKNIEKLAREELALIKAADTKKKKITDDQLFSEEESIILLALFDKIEGYVNLASDYLTELTDPAVAAVTIAVAVETGGTLAVVLAALAALIYYLKTKITQIKDAIGEKKISNFNELLKQTIDYILSIGGIPRIIHLIAYRQLGERVIKDIIKEDYGEIIKSICFLLFQTNSINATNELSRPSENPVFNNFKYQYEQNTENNLVGVINKTLQVGEQFAVYVCEWYKWITKKYKDCPNPNEAVKQLTYTNITQEPSQESNDSRHKYVENLKKLIEQLPKFFSEKDKSSSGQAGSSTYCLCLDKHGQPCTSSHSSGIPVEIVKILAMGDGILSDDIRINRLFGFLTTILDALVDILNNKEFKYAGGDRKKTKRKLNNKKKRTHKNKKPRKSRKGRKTRGK